ncbi:MAG: hypothetical protein LUE16_08920 [Lachnospiraceae bacterium]|nr:hypothetical protein [Lachnospiraceae bacterium]
MNQYFLKWQEGVADFKPEQGAVLLLFAASIFLIFQAGGMTRKRFASASVVLCLLTFLPFTAAFLLCGYSGFYDWQDLLVTVPVIPVLALGGCLAAERSSDGIVDLGTTDEERPEELFESADTAGGGNTARMKKRDKRRLWTAAAPLCVLFLFFAATNFHVFDSQEESEGYGIPAWAGEAFDSLREAVGERELQILGNNDLIMYARLYSADWYPVYGRDLWDIQAKGYVEYDYGELSQICDILAQDTISAGNSKVLISYVKETQPDCLIVLSSWEPELAMPADYNLVTLSGQYIAYIKITPEEET